MVKTNLKPRDYLPHEAVRIVNPKQSLLYIKNGVYPIDMYASIDEKQIIQFLQWCSLRKIHPKYIKNGVITNWTRW